MGNSDWVRALPTLAYPNVEKEDKTEAQLARATIFHDWNIQKSGGGILARAHLKSVGEFVSQLEQSEGEHIEVVHFDTDHWKAKHYSLRYKE